MYLQKTQYSKQRKQWTFLSNHLRQLIERGRFQQFSAKKQALLISKLKNLFQKMVRFEKASRLKKALGVAALLLGLQTTPSLQAQVDFAPVVTNPFGLSSEGTTLDYSTLVDIDGDGDLDIISIGYDYDAEIQNFNFIENESLNGGTEANFMTLVANYAGLTLPLGDNDTRYINAIFGDIDNDGDLDLFIGAFDYTYSNETYISKILYFENIGDVNTPAFALPIENPFNIDLGISEIAVIDLVDIDGDGDLDLFNTFYTFDESTDIEKTKIDFFENTGTLENAAFGPAQSGAFGLPSDFSPYKVYDLADIDNDGDIDMMAGAVGPDYDNSFSFLENIGTNQEPQFADPITNPFSLENTYGFVLWPILGDLDNDGDIDILTHSDYNETTEMLNWAFHENLLIAPVGTKNVSLAAKATVMPNISSGVVTLNIEADEMQEYYQFSLISATGQLLRQWEVEGGVIINEKIDLTTLPAAKYFIQVRTPEGVLVKKVIKQ